MKTLTPAQDAALREVRMKAEGLRHERESVARLELSLTDRIRRALEAGLSIRDLTDAAGMSKSAIHRLIQGGTE